MPHVTGQQRNQMMMFSLESSVAAGSFARVIDAFVEATDLESFGFAHVRSKDEGRPSFHPSVLLNLYLYGYHNGIRSSRKLEREAQLNLEAIWLTSGQYPRYKTIADFRKNHSSAFREVFRSFVRLLRDWELTSGETIAIDSFKIRAQNSLKNNLNQSKIDRHLEYIENKLAEYEKALAENDGDKQQIQDEIKKQNQRKDGYKKIEHQLKESGQRQISTSGPDSRHQITRNNITEVAYSAQTTVNAKNNIPIDYKVTNANDKKAMGEMLRRAKTILRNNNFTALYDKGYHTGSQLAIADALGIPAIVAIPPFSGASHAPDLNYDVEHSEYNPKTDTYTCLQGHTLTTTGYWHHAKNDAGELAYRFSYYTTQCVKAVR